jgi:hypothetical protein
MVIVYAIRNFGPEIDAKTLFARIAPHAPTTAIVLMVCVYAMSFGLEIDAKNLSARVIPIA